MHGPTNPKRSVKYLFFGQRKQPKQQQQQKKRTWMICNTTTEKFIGTVRKENKTYKPQVY